MDVTFSPGIIYVLVIDTNAYSGNFERQLCGYATGIFDYERGHGRQEAEAAMADAPETVKGIRKKAVAVQHFEYGMVFNTIRATPGRINNGTGQCRDALPNEQGWPAYESVAIFFNKLLTKAEMDYVRRRAEEYAAKPGEHVKPFCIKDMYLVEVVTTVEERRTSEFDAV